VGVSGCVVLFGVGYEEFGLGRRLLRAASCEMRWVLTVALDYVSVLYHARTANCDDE
jgi:hypothetical protein